MPIEEDAPTVPLNPYGASKLAVDRMLDAEAARHGIAAVSLRYFNVAGSYATSWREAQPRDPPDPTYPASRSRWPPG